MPLLHGKILIIKAGLKGGVMQESIKPRKNKFLFSYVVRCCLFIVLMAGFALETRTVQAATGNLFLPYQAVKTGSRPSAVAIADLNGDGKNDVALTTTYNNDPANDATLFIFLQDQAGQLQPPVKYYIGGSPESIAIGDVNGDGKNDVVVGNSNINQIGVFTQNATGTFDPVAIYPTANGRFVKTGDFNNDGKSDVVAMGWGSNSVDVFLQNSSGLLSAPATYAVNHGGYDEVETGDVNGDGLTDIIVMSGQGYAVSNIGVLLQQPGGSISAPVYYDLGGDELMHGVAVGDINGDTLNDIVVSYGGNKPTSFVGAFQQNSSGNLNPAVSYPSYDIPESIEVGDVDGDGKKDVITVHGGWNKLGVYVQAGDGILLTEDLYDIPYASHYNPQGLAVGDVNEDGAADAVIADYNNGLVLLYGSKKAPQLVVTPAPLTFPATLPGAVAKQPVKLSNAGTVALAITQLELAGSQEFSLGQAAAGGCGPLPLTIVPGGSCSYDVIFAPVYSGTKDATISVTSNDPANPVTTLQVSGFSPVPVPVISVSPAAVAFPSTPSGSTVTQSVQLANTGTASLTVAKLEIAGLQASEFSVGGPNVGGCGSLPAVVAPGTACSITIGFSPATPGTKAATLVVSSSDPVNPSKNVQLSGSSPVPNTGGVFSDDMEGGTVKWLTPSGLWHINDATSLYPNRHSGTRSWWYGKEATGNYDAGLNRGELVTVPFVVPANGKLSFWSWEQTEGGTYYDKRTVLISTNNGATWTQLYASSDNTATWRQVNVDLSGFSGSTVQLKFFFDTVDGSVNYFRGWYIDDVVVASPVVTPAPTFSDDIESGAAKWESAAGLWHIAPTGSVNSKSHSGTKSWWYGQEATGNYSTGAANKGELVSTPFVVGSGSKLTFWSWEQTEGGTYYDKRLVYISTNNGATWTQIFQSTDNSALWHQVAVSLSAYAGSTVKIKFVFDSVDGIANTYRGWYIDDVVVGP